MIIQEETSGPDLMLDYDYCGVLMFIDGLFKRAKKDLKAARRRNDQREIYRITKFYQSDFCQFLVESSGYDFDWFLEVKGLKSRGDSGGAAGA